MEQGSIHEAESRLLAKVASIESQHAGDGGSARDRIRERLRESEKTDPPIEYRFSIPDPWKRRVFCALVRRYGLSPYRHHGQRRTTIMVRVSKRFVDAILWPEFVAIAQALESYLEVVTERVIAKAVHEDVSDGEEAPTVTVKATIVGKES